MCQDWRLMEAFGWKVARDCARICTGILLAELTVQLCAVAFTAKTAVTSRKCNFYISKAVTTFISALAAVLTGTTVAAMGSTYYDDVIQVYAAFLILRTTSLGLFSFGMVS